jgi:hypothetical protein
MDGNEANSFSSLVRAIRFVHPVEALEEERRTTKPRLNRPAKRRGRHNGMHRRRRKKMTW